MADFDRDKAEALLLKYVKTPHIIPHSYAVEAVMRKLAERFAPEDAQMWAMGGLLHDLDEDLVDWRTDMSLHGPKAVEVLKEENYGCEEMYHAILAHNPKNGTKIENTFDRCMYAADPITGFITAIAKVYPDKRVKSVKVKSIVKRMDETRFAAGANREAMWSIERLDMDFQDFAQLALSAMCEIDDVLGLA